MAMLSVMGAILSCDKESGLKTSKVTIHASISENSPSTKTSIDENGKVNWVPGDDFYVYSISTVLGNDAPSNFESDLDHSAPSADFTGELEIDENETYFAFYPGASSTYNLSSYWGDEYDGAMDGQFYGYLSPDQAENYDTYSEAYNFEFCGNMMLAAISEGSVDRLSFKNVCSGLKFSLSEAGYTEVSISGNDGEAIAGAFTLDFDSFTNEPIATPSDGAETIAKISADWGFIDGEWLYILILPQTFEKGITISLKKNGIAAGSLIINNPVEFKRGVWKKVANIDDKVAYSDFDENGNIVFADKVVENICVSNWDTDGDGGISLSEAQAVTDLGTVFRGKKNIETFNELRFFTGLTTIPEYAFRESSIKEIRIPDSVTSIGKYAFYECSSLQGELVLPKELISIGTGAFEDCSSLIGDLDLRNVTSIGGQAFMGCSGLNGSLILSDSLTKIEVQTFSSCGFTGSLVIPDSVTEIGRDAFWNCDNFSGTLTIGSGVTVINTFAFVCGDVYTYHCPFNTIIARGTTPASLMAPYNGRVSDVGPFSETKSGTTSLGAKYNYKAPDTLYVPIGYVETYKTAWSSWASTASVIEREI